LRDHRVRASRPRSYTPPRWIDAAPLPCAPGSSPFHLKGLAYRRTRTERALRPPLWIG
jgi:hypothetical protein